MRKRFLMQLPALKKDLNEGMKLIGWPDAAQKDFFGKLLPSHAESLKATPMTELEHNLLAKQLEGIFQTGMPDAHEFSQAEPVTLDSQEIEQRFTSRRGAAGRPGRGKRSRLVGRSRHRPERRRNRIPPTCPTPAAAQADTTPSDLGLDINLDLAAPTRRAVARPALMDHIASASPTRCC
jgi:hypothetical protein